MRHSWLEGRNQQLYRKRSAALLRQQRSKPACAVERDQVVIPADVLAPDVNLRDSPATRLFHHFLAPSGLEIDPDLVDLRHALGAKQTLGLHAERADRRR